LLVTYLRQFRRVAGGTPLSYVIRKHAAAMTKQRLVTYPTIDDNLIATASHETPSFRIDNGTVIGGEGWPFILKHNNDRDGIKSWDSLELQAENPAAITTHKAEAYTSIEKALYSGHSAKYTFDIYVSTHLTSHNKLSLLGEPVSDPRRSPISLLVSQRLR
jgi:hypothetical protein